MNAMNYKTKNLISFDLLKESLNNFKEKNKFLEDINVEKVIDFSKKFEYLYNISFLKKMRFARFIRNKIIYFVKYETSRKVFRLKKNYYNAKDKEKELFYFIIPILKIFIDKKNHKGIQKMLLLLIDFFIDKILTYDIFIITIELMLIILTNLFKSNSDCFYNINDDPFEILNDIIIALISYEKEIEIEDPNKYIFTDVIHLLNKYLLSQNFPNIIISQTPIWLKLLENHMITSTFISENSNEKKNVSINNKISAQNQLYSFLIKIYKFSMRNDYIENIIIKNCIIDLNYYLNALNFLKKLFFEEIETTPISEFKIKNGIFIPKNKYIFFNNIKPSIKINEMSIIFSFKLFFMEENKIIEILEIFDKKTKSNLYLYVNEKGFLTIKQTENKKLETTIKIKENVCYFLSMSLTNSFTKGTEINLLMNKEKKPYTLKINNIDFSKEFSLTLGKNNYFGIIGDFLIINKALADKKKSSNLFKLREDYSIFLRKLNYKFQILRKTKMKYKDDYNKSEEFKTVKGYFEHLGFEIIFEINGSGLIYKSSENIFHNIDIKKDLDNNDRNYITPFGNNSEEKNEIKEDNINISNNIISNDNGDDYFNKNTNNYLFKNNFNMNYSYDIFYLCNGIDFLSFQIYNIFSKITDVQLLNIYLNETLSFIMNIFTYQENNFKRPESEKSKLDTENILFFLTLLIELMNKKKEIYLSSDVIQRLIEISGYFNNNKLISERNMILSILLDIDFYKEKEDIFNYIQMFNPLLEELEEKQNDEKNSSSKKEFFFKLLMLDFCFEKKEMNHKTLTKLISGYITSEEKHQKEISIFNEFIQYFLSIKNEAKIYRYLKIIYLNLPSIKVILNGDNNSKDKNKNKNHKNSTKDNSNKKSSIDNRNSDNNELLSNFLENIINGMQSIKYDHCEYCSYNQILYYLINQEIINIKTNDDVPFIYSPTGFMINPSILFLKCFFSQAFNFSKKERIKFIKKDSDSIDYIFSLMKYKKEFFNYDKFNKRFEIIINYIRLLIEQGNIKDQDLLNKILFFFNFILNFLKRLSENEINAIKNKETKEIKEKENEIICKEKKDNYQSLFSNKNFHKFFDIYMNLDYNQAFKEIQSLIKLSINYETFPFYFWFFVKKSNFNENGINDSKLKVFKVIVEELISQKINYDINNNSIIVINNIAFLICLYNYLLNNKDETNSEFKQLMLFFITNLQDKNFYYCKYAFNVDLEQSNDVQQDNQEKKFILEIVCDIYFLLYERNNYDLVYFYLLRGIFLSDKIIDILKIDSQYFQEEKNRENAYNFYNQNYLTKIADGEESKDIIFSVYLMNYLLEKIEKYESVNIKKEELKIKVDPLKLINEIMGQLVKNIEVILVKYKNQITYSIKNLQKKNKYKSYINLLEYIKNKHKSKKFTLDVLITHYKKTMTNKEVKFQRKNKRKKTEVLSSLEILKSKENDSNKKSNEHDNIYISKLSIPNIPIKEKRNNSFSYISSRKEFILEKLEFNEIEGKYNLEKKEINNINIVRKGEKTNTMNLKKKESSRKLFYSFERSGKVSTKNEKNNRKESFEMNYLKDKLQEILIPFKYFKRFFHLTDSSVINQLFNPKKYYIWNKFFNILKNIIYSQKKFKYVSLLFKIKFQNKNPIKSSNLKNRDFHLNYPIKLKNFICDDYYRPFTKPDLNFFEDQLLHISHNYLNLTFFREKYFQIDQINKIEFPRFLPIESSLYQSRVFVCECINDKGSYFGNIYVNHAFLLFVTDYEKDPRIKGNSKTYENEDIELYYLYSFFLDERITDKNKYVIIFTKSIKEIIIRRICFNYIGYEILLKNNKSYFFNFFNPENVQKFIQCLVLQIEKNRPERDRNLSLFQDVIRDILDLPIISVNISDDINFEIINKLDDCFEKKDFRWKHSNKEISNFKYLLLLNKYASRSYNDLYQYLIFPLLYMDPERKIKRDLTKPLALNKEGLKYQETLESIKTNYENFGCHFNANYSTSGYVLYYLVRMNPFTTGHIKLQTNQFDLPRRMFYTINYYLKAITSSEENRELVPEFFHNYEIFLNLNYLNLGYIPEEKIQINDIDTNDKNGIAEFIISLRQQLEKVDIIPWVDCIFGKNQNIEDSGNNSEIYNIFPRTSYEKDYNFVDIRKELIMQGKNKTEVINEIKVRLNLLSVGMIPVQLYKTPLKKKKPSTKGVINEKNPNIKQNAKKPIDLNYLKNLNKFLGVYYERNCLIYVTEDIYGKKLVIENGQVFNIFKLFNNESNNKIIKKELVQKNNLKLYPLSKTICELYQDIFLSCRYLDRILRINYSNKKIMLYHDNIITSVELLSDVEKKDNIKDITNHKCKFIIGDEIGNLSLIKLEYDMINKNKIEIQKCKIWKNIKLHNSFIQGILYNKRLNIIISYSEEGQIAINNAYDLSIINIIELGNEYYIKDLKISQYDLIYIFCTNKENEKYNYIKCYSLNGIKYTELETEKRINNYFVYETLMVVYENNFIEVFNLYEIEGNPIIQKELNKDKDTTNTDKNNNKNKERIKENKILLCTMNNVDKKLVIIYDDLQVEVEDVSKMIIKE